ncbi:hypothetical protein QBC40DRAFT_181394 [Triangularia verruculosa]|uniref:Uncharacterized protein n=1 Tax=Triangularia verruculosa TaxID=2587418 RepID=A0AAN6XAV0_9PEZI|nr:hypothetical protein QBC40DRAFT_181394 [Triangularia verruculosa]
MNNGRPKPGARTRSAVTDAPPTADSDTTATPVLRPMDILTQRGAVDDDKEGDRREAKGFSRNYRGDINNPRNKPSAMADDQNVSLFITKLPATLEARELLKALIPHAPFGRVFSVSITPPNIDKGQKGAAAKVVMFSREGTEKLHDFIQRGGLFFDVGFTKETAQVCWNQIKSDPSTHDDDKSRVLIITGSTAVVGIPELRTLFCQNFDYQEEEVTVVRESETKRTVEFRFCSFRSQAEVGSILLRRLYGRDVRVEFGIDPLAVRPISDSGHPAAQATTNTKSQASQRLKEDRWAKLGQWRRGGPSA